LAQKDGDGVILLILLIAVGSLIGVSIYLFINPAAMTVAYNIFNPIFSPVITTIGNFTNSLPSPFKEILASVSIPSILGLIFMAYTKVKAMRQLNEVTQAKDQAVTSLTGQIAGATGTAEAVSGSLADKITTLTTQLNDARLELERKQDTITTLTGNLEDSSKIRIQREEDIRHLNMKIKELQYQLDVATGKIQLPIK